MRLLLDTHIWLWSLLEPRRLSRRVSRELADPANQLWLSPISVWETLILCQKGRLALNEGPSSWIAKAMRSSPVAEAPLNTEVVLETAKIRLPQRDPADHFLVATARVLELTLVTADDQIIQARQSRTLASR